MTKLTDALIKMGEDAPELRPHLRPILAELERQAAGVHWLWLRPLSKKILDLLVRQVVQNGWELRGSYYEDDMPGGAMIGANLIKRRESGKPSIERVYVQYDERRNKVKLVVDGEYRNAAAMKAPGEPNLSSSDMDKIAKKLILDKKFQRAFKLAFFM